MFIRGGAYCATPDLLYSNRRIPDATRAPREKDSPSLFRLLLGRPSGWEAWLHANSNPLG